MASDYLEGFIKNREQLRQLCYFGQRADGLAVDASIRCYLFMPIGKEVKARYSLVSTGDADLQLSRITNPEAITGDDKQDIFMLSGFHNVKNLIETEIHTTITGAPSFVELPAIPVFGGAPALKVGGKLQLDFDLVCECAQIYLLELTNRDGVDATLHQQIIFYTDPAEQLLFQFVPN